jgi:hypothetical protein
MMVMDNLRSIFCKKDAALFCLARSMSPHFGVDGHRATASKYVKLNEGA